MIQYAKKILRPARDRIKSIYIENQLRNRINKHNDVAFDTFNFEKFRSRVISFIQTSRVDEKHYLYKYSASCTKPTLYGSVYALMTLSLLGEIDKLSIEEKEEWRRYFDAHQNPSDGLFYDPILKNNIYSEADWWGARHITMHMISAYTELGFRPKYPFIEVEKYNDKYEINKIIDSVDWMTVDIGSGDVDNRLMNIGCMLQYQRDNWGDSKAAIALNELKRAIRLKINPDTGMWGVFNTKNPYHNSRMIQFAYHIFLIFFYDGDFDFDCEKIAHYAISTQNKFGGYGVKLNSSACEDIDSIDILVRLYHFCDVSTKKKIDESISRSFSWVLENQVSDGGFVFRLFESFKYGSSETSSKANEGAMLPTWFRLLSLAYISSHIGGNDSPFNLTDAPGCEFSFIRHIGTEFLEYDIRAY